MRMLCVICFACCTGRVWHLLLPGVQQDCRCVSEHVRVTEGQCVTQRRSCREWQCLCRRHRLGVAALAWAPDAQHFVSGSLDRDAMVWEAPSGAIVATLSGHGSFVKGVAWDPINSYVATMSEDKCVRLWSTEDWRNIAQLTQGLQHMPLHIPFCRWVVARTVSLRACPRLAAVAVMPFCIHIMQAWAWRSNVL